MKVPTQAEIEDKLRGEDLNTWLDLWHAEQGPAKPDALKLIAAAIPFPVDRSLRVLDVGCGPGDAGRVIYSRFLGARIDFVDRNEFFVSLCDAVNRRDGITRIGDGLTVMQWVGLLKDAGLESVDILLRDAEK